MNPTNLQEAVEFLMLAVPKEELEQFKGMSLDDFCTKCHFGLGRAIRNKWNLWDENSNLHKYFKEIGLFHPDDMSSIITKSFWAKATGTEYDIKEDIRKYKKYWEIMSTHPTTIPRWEEL